MNKQDLISALSLETGKTKKDCEQFIDSFSKIIKKTLKEGEIVSLVGLVRFIYKDHPERIIRDPRTQEKIKIESRRTYRAQISSKF